MRRYASHTGVCHANCPGFEPFLVVVIFESVHITSYCIRFLPYSMYWFSAQAHGDGKNILNHARHFFSNETITIYVYLLIFLNKFSRRSFIIKLVQSHTTFWDRINREYFEYFNISTAMYSYKIQTVLFNTYIRLSATFFCNLK